MFPPEISLTHIRKEGGCKRQWTRTCVRTGLESADIARGALGWQKARFSIIKAAVKIFQGKVEMVDLTLKATSFGVHSAVCLRGLKLCKASAVSCY